MAFISAGYDGTVDEIQFAGMLAKAGASEYGIDKSAHFRVTAVAGQDRTVNIAAGAAWGHSVTDVMDANVTVQLPAVSSGTRWDMIVLRRDWQPPGGQTTIAVVTGTASPTLPVRSKSPGVVDDQPIALVRVQAGSTAILEILDLRVWARNGGVTAKHDLARSFIEAIGTVIEINGTVWRRRVAENSLPVWEDVAKVDDTGVMTSGLPISMAQNWRMDYYEVRRRNGALRGQIAVTYLADKVIDSGPEGDIPADVVVATMPAGYRPARLSWPGVVRVPGHSEWFGRIDPNGFLIITHGLPNQKITKNKSFIFYVDCPVD